MNDAIINTIPIGTSSKQNGNPETPYMNAVIQAPTNTKAPRPGLGLVRASVTTGQAEIKTKLTIQTTATAITW